MKKVAAKVAGPTKSKESSKPAPKDEKLIEGDLQGKIVRVVDESSMHCGMLVEVTGQTATRIFGQTAFKDSVKDIFDAKVPAKVTLPIAAVSKISDFAKPDPAPFKILKFTHEERAIMEMKFDPEELEHVGSSLKDDSRLAAIHLDLWFWLVQRDHAIQEKREIVWLSPGQLANIHYELNAADAAENFVRIVGELAAQLKDAKVVLLPVWGGTAGEGDQHWTLLIVSKLEDGWSVSYKDSLSKIHKQCSENAQKLLTTVSAAVNADLKFPGDSSNKKLQDKGSIVCGQCVCHWVESKVREEMGEGLHSIGHCNVQRITQGISRVVDIIINDKGSAAIHTK